MNHKLPRRGLRALAFATSIALAVPGALRAEDIDLFTTGAASNNKPNILVILDSSSNWSASLGPNSCQQSVNGVANDPPVANVTTKFGAEVCALYKVVGGLNANVRFGLMMFTESGDNGAYVRYAVRDMTPGATGNIAAFKSMLAGFISNGSGTDNSGANQPYAKAMYEAFKYFGGYTSPAHATDDTAGGTNDKTHFGPTAFAGGSVNNSGTFRRDYKNNNTPANRAAPGYGADAFSAFASNTSDSYDTASAPITNACAKNFIVFISNGNPSTGGDSSTNPARDTALLTNVGATTQAIPSAAAETHPSKMDEFALFLNQTDVSPLPGQQKVITYTIAVYQPSGLDANGNEIISNSDQQMIKLMKSAASVGGGKYFSGSSADKVVAALSNIVNEVQSVNSVFVSASLPVSVNNQGTFLNQVYMGMFRPDGTGSARWLGNLKEYKFILDASTGSISLADSLGNSIVNPATGFLSPSAVSYWTSAGSNPAGTGWPAKNFWVNSQSGTPLSASDSPDGEVVEKGGASEQQRITYATIQTARRVFTCLSGGCSAGSTPADFNTTNITGAAYQAAFGAVLPADLTATVNWIRGQDNVNGIPCDPTVSGCTWSSAEAGPGWSATVRPSIHGDVLHSRPVVLNYTSLAGCATTGCPYIFYGSNDGTLRALKGGQLATDGLEQWSFVAPEFYSKFARLRLGVPELRTPDTPAALFATTLPKDYFFDGPIGSWEDPNGTTKWIFVTARRGGKVIYAFDVSDPVNPKFMWKKTGTDADFTNVGQTWSLPTAFKLTGAADPYLVFGAGYDTGDDSSPAVGTGVGRGIYVLNARTGVTLAFIQSGVNGTISNPIPADMAFLATSAGQAYRAYVGDTGGNVWRLDIPDSNVANWKLFKFATLATGQKVMFAPDVVHAGSYDVVLIGTGDREKPLVSTSADSFYALNDSKNDPAVATSVTTLTPSDLTLLSGNSGTSSLCGPPTCMGWYRNLAAGEKVVNSPLTVAGTTYFATNMPVPSSSSCNANLGQAKAYALSFSNGAAPSGASGISTTLTGGGLPPSPVGGIVEIAPGKLVSFVIGAGSKGSAIEGSRVNLSIPKQRTKIYWSSKIDK